MNNPERFSAWGPWVREPLDLRRAGVIAVHRGPEVVALTFQPRALEAARRGDGQIAHDRRCAQIVDEDATTRVVRLCADPGLHPGGVEGSGRRERVTARRRTLIDEICGIRSARALRKLGVRASRVDRWLDAEVAIEVTRGATFGGVVPPMWGRDGERTVCALTTRARAEGWTALDPVGWALTQDLGPEDVRALVGEREELDLAWVGILIRDQPDNAGGRLDAYLERALREPPEVRVTIEGPPWVDVSRWADPGATVTASRARWLLTHLDGLMVGGTPLRVHTDPAIRSGRRGPVRGADRRRVFRRWSEGIRADEEGLYSATPEALALRMAKGAHGVVLDATCGVGGNAIAFARQPEVHRVIAVDRHEKRLAMARHNAEIYGVAHRMEFVCADAKEVIESRDADLVMIDPPWGGVDYDRTRVGMDALGLDLRALIDASAGRAVMLKLPRSFEVAALGDGWRWEAMVDDRGVLKFLWGRQTNPSTRPSQRAE